MHKRIYIIEDDRALNHGIAAALANESYEFRNFYNLGEVETAETTDLIILDLNLPVNGGSTDSGGNSGCCFQIAD